MHNYRLVYIVIGNRQLRQNAHCIRDNVRSAAEGIEHRRYIRDVFIVTNICIQANEKCG